jgi:tetratricopeptide (TPR) repeat protein
MRRIITGFVVTGAFLTLCLVGTISRSTAEPIPGADVSAATDDSPQAQVVTAAAERFKDGDLEGTLKILKDAAKKDPDLPPPQIVMTHFFAQARAAARMRYALEQAVIEDPNDPEAYALMGNIAMSEGRITEAELLFEKANSLVAKFDKSKKRKEMLEPAILGGLAAALQARQNWADAQKPLEAWLKLAPKSTAALQQLALCLFKQKNAQGALEKLTAAAALDPKAPAPEAMLAQFYEQDGDRANAKKSMAAALTKAPESFQTRFIAARWALETEQLKDAATQADAALKLDPDSSDAKMLRGVIALFQKDYAKAEEYFKLAHLQAPREFGPSNNLALALIEQKDDAKKSLALEYADGNMKQFPNRAEAVSTYGWVMFQLGKIDEAEKAFQSVAASGNVKPDTAYYIAKVSVARDKKQLAIQWLENAMKSTGPFAMRKEAKALLDELKKK